MVTEIHSGRCGATSRAAAMAALAFSVSKIVSISSRSTPPSASAAICSAYAAWTWSKVTARYAGSSTRGDSDRVTFSGPIEPATNRPAGLVRGLAGQLGAAQVHVAHQRLQAVVGLADAGRGERVRGGDVRAGRQVLPVHVEDRRPGGSGSAGPGRR